MTEVRCYANPKHKAFRSYVYYSDGKTDLAKLWLIACPKCKLIWYDVSIN